MSHHRRRRRSLAVPPALLAGSVAAVCCLTIGLAVPAVQSSGSAAALLKSQGALDQELLDPVVPRIFSVVPQPVVIAPPTVDAPVVAAAPETAEETEDADDATAEESSGPLRRIPGREIWAGGLETGDLSEFHDTPWETVDADDPRVVTSPTRSGGFALRVSIPAGASTDSYGNRSETVPGIRDLQPGDDLYFGVSMYLAGGFPVQENWQVVTQWKSHLNGSPPLELSVEDGQFFLCGGEGHPDGAGSFCEAVGPAVTGRWVDWVFRIRFSPDRGDSSVQVWRDGAEVLAPFSPPGATMYPDGDGASGYWKVGYYRRSDIGPEGTIYYDNITVREAV